MSPSIFSPLARVRITFPPADADSPSSWMAVTRTLKRNVTRSAISGIWAVSTNEVTRSCRFARTASTSGHNLARRDPVLRLNISIAETGIDLGRRREPAPSLSKYCIAKGVRFMEPPSVVIWGRSSRTVMCRWLDEEDGSCARAMAMARPAGPAPRMRM